MAVVFADAQSYARTDSLLTGAFSFCAWVYRTSDNTVDNVVLWGHNAGFTSYTAIARNASNRCVIFDSTTAYSAPTSPEFSTNAWYFIAWAQPAASNGQVWIWDTSGTMGTASDGAVRPLADNTILELGISFSTGGLIGRAAGVKLWNAVLTEAEFVNEMRSLRPRRTSNLYLWSPFLNGADTVDHSGNGRSWTAAGSPTSGDGPPVGWGAAPYIIGNPAAAGPGGRNPVSMGFDLR